MIMDGTKAEFLGDVQGRAAYKDLLVWQKSMHFANAVIDLTEQLDTERKHYRLVEQLEAAATSLPMNIAEGKGKFFSQGI